MTNEPIDNGNGDQPKNPSEATFRSTRWSVVLTLGESNPERARKALEELCRIYWPPLYAYVRRKGIPPHDAKDLVQGFFQHLCQGNGFQGYSPKQKVKFRTWLLSCLKRFEIDVWRKNSANKRGGDIVQISLDLEDEEGNRVYEIPGSDTPESAFDAAYARRLVQQIFLRLEAEQTKLGHGDLYAELKVQLLKDGKESASQPDSALAAKFGMTKDNIAKRRERLRKRFGEILREEIGQLVAADEDIDEEIRCLFRALG